MMEGQEVLKILMASKLSVYFKKCSKWEKERSLAEIMFPKYSSVQNETNYEFNFKSCCAYMFVHITFIYATGL